MEKCISSATKERVQRTWADATQCRLLSPSGAIRKKSGKLSTMQVTKSISITHFPIALLSGSLACIFAGQSVKKQGCFIEPHHAENPKREFVKMPAGPLQTFPKEVAEYSSLLVHPFSHSSLYSILACSLLQSIAKAPIVPAGT